MGNASIEDLQNLFRTCSPATFGRGQEDVLDESYRKAAKLDEDRFATKLDIEKSGLMEAIRNDLLEGDQGKEFHAELYKLNIYDKKLFFKTHRDTPRGKDMFGSLVIAFPTAHEGGELIIRQDKKEWVFDSGRATLTYNLYFGASAGGIVRASRILGLSNRGVSILKSALSSLLEDPEFLEDGGSLGFGLFHQYPDSKWELKDLKGCLKGRDAIIMQACHELSLKADLWYLYSDSKETDDMYKFLSQYVVDPSPEYGQGIVDFVVKTYDDVRVIHSEFGRDKDSEEGGILWVNDLKKFNIIESQYATYGNEISADCTYGKVCLIVDIALQERGV